jgi:hypothetical protein
MSLLLVRMKNCVVVSEAQEWKNMVGSHTHHNSQQVTEMWPQPWYGGNQSPPWYLAYL